MEIKINKEIRNYKETIFFGLSMRQFVCAVLAVGVAVGLYFALNQMRRCGARRQSCRLTLFRRGNGWMRQTISAAQVAKVPRTRETLSFLSETKCPARLALLGWLRRALFMSYPLIGTAICVM